MTDVGRLTSSSTSGTTGSGTAATSDPTPSTPQQRVVSPVRVGPLPDAPPDAVGLYWGTAAALPSGVGPSLLGAPSSGQGQARVRRVVGMCVSVCVRASVLGAVLLSLRLCAPSTSLSVVTPCTLLYGFALVLCAAGGCPSLHWLPTQCDLQ